MSLFSRNFWKILSLAVIGTLASTAITWYALYTDYTDMLIDLGFSESGQFAALISAVDPVATLSLFSTLQVDPSLNNMVVGESVLNDAVALITFRHNRILVVHLHRLEHVGNLRSLCFVQTLQQRHTRQKQLHCGLAHTQRLPCP